MKKITKRAVRCICAVLTVVICVTVVVPSSVFKTTAVDDATANSYREQIAALESKQQTLKSKLSSLKSEAASAYEYKNNLDELGNVTQTKIATAEALTAELTIKIDQTTQSIAEKEENIKTTFNNFLQRMCVSYEEGEASYLSIILGSESMSDFLSKMDMVSSMLEYDRNLKNQYETEKTELEAEKAQLEEDKALQEETLKNLEADKAEYEKLSAESAGYIKSLESDIAATNSAYETAKQQENALDAQLTQYLASLQQKEQSVYVGGEFIWPLNGYTSISSGFGWRTLGGVSDYHRGIDIPAPSGTPIHAANGGTVVTATGHGSYGNYVVINHGGGKSTLYAHMSAIGCSVGQTVSQGQVIGYVGTTGYSTGNHLHIEVRIDGVANNPLNYLSR